MINHEPGEFCRIFGTHPRTIMFEFFLEGGEVDSPISEVIEETGLNKATAYNTAKELIKEKYLIQTRKVAGARFYKLNKAKGQVQVLFKAFDIVLKGIAKRYAPENKIVVKNQ